MSGSIEIIKGSDNIFADIGVPDPREHRLKADLVLKIAAIMKERALTQVATARIIGVTQPEVSNMLRGRFRRTSVTRLLQHLVALGQNVDIVVTPHRGAPEAAQLRLA